VNKSFHIADIAIVGSGFAGSLLAMIARRLGRSVVLLEKSKHPRFAIGESSTPLANLLLEELASRYDLPRLLPLCKWGSWQRAYPEIGCGLKRGFTFLQHEFGRPFETDAGRSRQLLVAASPHDGISDTHWYRPDFDDFLVREARGLGAEYLDEVTLDAPVWSDDGVVLAGRRQDVPIEIHARFVVDATGPRGYLHRALGLAEESFEHLPGTQGLYTHFRGVKRLADLGFPGGDETPPFPVDDAAVHHVFDGGWIWVLRFGNGLCSAGVAAVDTLADELGFAEGAPAWRRLLLRLPTVAEQFAEAEAELPFVHARRLSFLGGMDAGGAGDAGERWALLPSAAGFVDPLMSTGFPLTLLGVARLAEAFAHEWGSDEQRERIRLYARQTREELLAAERLVAALYASFGDFERFAAISLLYFAAASFAETARRLGRPELAGSFLLHDHPVFGPGSRACLDQALGRGDQAGLIERIRETIEPFDVAGLSDPSRRSWYPVEAGDLLRAAGKLGADPGEIRALLARSGFVPSPPDAVG
jgi:FADH2 O2-dependent halogenase